MFIFIFLIIPSPARLASFIFVFLFSSETLATQCFQNAKWNCSALKKHRGFFIHAGMLCGESYCRTGDRQTALPLQPKIDGDKYVDEYFMAASSGMPALKWTGELGLARVLFKKNGKMGGGAKKAASGRQTDTRYIIIPPRAPCMSQGY